MVLSVGEYARLSQGWMSEGADLECVLVRLREEGLNEIQCHAVLRAVTGWDYATAKAFVERSRAWGDVAADRNRLFENVESSLRDLEDP
jgi:hypothetical protein